LTRAIAAGHRIASFAPAASDLEELFLQITATETVAGPGPDERAVSESMESDR
jgi:hypothetical protein